MVNTAPRAARRSAWGNPSTVPWWMTLCIWPWRIFPPLPTVPENQAFTQH